MHRLLQQSLSPTGHVSFAGIRWGTCSSSQQSREITGKHRNVFHCPVSNASFPCYPRITFSLRAVVGFDDNSSSAHMEPALTTVRQPFYEMGRRACEILLTLVDTPRPVNGPAHNGRMSGIPASIFDEPIRIKMPTSLIVRASCGASHRITI